MPASSRHRLVTTAARLAVGGFRDDVLTGRKRYADVSRVRRPFLGVVRPRPDGIFAASAKPIEAAEQSPRHRRETAGLYEPPDLMRGPIRTEWAADERSAGATGMNISFLDPHIAANLAASAGAAALLLPVRAGLLYRLRSGDEAAGRDRRLARSRVRTAFGLLLAVTLGAIWFAEIQSLIWSVTAVIVAFTIATKELIQCGTGALMRAAGRSFRVGDRLEIDGVYGQIVAHGILTTTIAEIERAAGGCRETGRTIVMPNSRLFAAEVRIDLRESTLVSHRFHVIFDPSVSTQAAVKALEAALTRYCAPFAEEVEAASGALRSSRSGEVVSRPLVTLGTTDLARIRLDALCTVPAGLAMELEREVKMEFLEWLWADAQQRQLGQREAGLLAA